MIDFILHVLLMNWICINIGKWTKIVEVCLWCCMLDIGLIFVKIKMIRLPLILMKSCLIFLYMDWKWIECVVVWINGWKSWMLLKWCCSRVSGLFWLDLGTVLCHIWIVVVMDIVVYCRHVEYVNWGVKQMNYVEGYRQSNTMDCLGTRS